MAIDIHLSVRALAEFMLRSGSIDSRFSGVDRGALGTRLHRRLQKKAGHGYVAEVKLEHTQEQGGFCYHLNGRADGVITTGQGIVVDEIKTTAAPLHLVGEDDHPAHWAQGQIYAHILCERDGLGTAGVQLRYCNIDTEEVKTFERSYTAKELAGFVRGLLQGYEKWAELSTKARTERDAALRELAFPFAEYREGQRKMAVACYNTIKDGGRLFACAPTGIGKTVSALFPALKAMGEGYGERIFYLTAKTIARKAAEDALALMAKNQPLPLRSLTLTAKEKICFLEQRTCLPEMCPYANGYYDRLNDALYEILQTHTALPRETVQAAAEKYKLCPYELSLDLALWCDCIIGDYNYLFDPVVHLQRFFESGKGGHVFLVDEAHNLVERGREMYSARLAKGDFFALKKALPKQHTRLHKALAGINNAFIKLRKQCEAEGIKTISQTELPTELEKPVERFVAATEVFLEEHRGSEWEDELLALYFEALFYQRIAEEYGGNYQTLIHRWGSDVSVKLFCLDASAFLDKSLSLGRAAVLFSATLQPLAYYRNVLGGGEDAKLLNLQSPFAHENLGLFVAAGVSTKYADREQSLGPVAQLLAGMVAARRGNYIAYFPSYVYMQQVLDVFCEAYPDVRTHVQAGGMDEEAREEFLAAFSAEGEESMLGFCVLGGVFAEGVDLVGERLIGTAVVGVGLPQMGPQPDALRRYFDEVNGEGFAYAYQFPGMNKVLQAAGRVIRTPQDTGVVLLIDSRFATPRYKAMFPNHWSHWRSVTAKSLQEELEAFWMARVEGDK